MARSAVSAVFRNPPQARVAQPLYERSNRAPAPRVASDSRARHERRPLGINGSAKHLPQELVVISHVLRKLGSHTSRGRSRRLPGSGNDSASTATGSSTSTSEAASTGDSCNCDTSCGTGLSPPPRSDRASRNSRRRPQPTCSRSRPAVSTRTLRIAEVPSECERDPHARRARGGGRSRGPLVVRGLAGAKRRDLEFPGHGAAGS